MPNIPRLRAVLMHDATWSAWTQPLAMVYWPYTLLVKSFRTPTHSRVFLYFYYFQHCRISYEIKTMKLHMESCCNQKSVKQIKNIFDILQIATLWLDDSFAHAWHSLNQLHLECFSNSLEWVPTYAEHLLATSLWPDSSQTISIGLRSVDCEGQVICCSTPSLSFLVK